MFKYLSYTGVYMKKNEVWNVKCACGCGEDVPRPKRKNKHGGYPKFILNHWWRLPEYMAKRKYRKRKEIPDISPCVGRRFRGGRYWSREVMEINLGRKLSPNEHVHHINGDKTDDRIENLIIISRSEHKSLHGNTSPIFEYTCDGCGKKFYRKLWRQKKSKKNYCNKICFYNSSLRRKLTPKQYDRHFRINAVAVKDERTANKTKRDVFKGPQLATVNCGSYGRV
jgi:hypothetical protein